MLVKMKETMPGSVNGGRTTQDFEAGKVYDVPADVGGPWVRDGQAEDLRVRKPAPASDKAAKGPGANKS